MTPPRRFLFLLGGYYSSTPRTALFAKDWVTLSDNFSKGKEIGTHEMLWSKFFREIYLPGGWTRIMFPIIRGPPSRPPSDCRLRKKALGKLGKEKVYEAKVPSSRRAYFHGRWVEKTKVELLEAMKPDHPLKGSAIVESAFTTVVIEPGAEVVRRRSGSLVITP